MDQSMVYYIINEYGQSTPVQILSDGQPRLLDANDPLMAQLDPGPGMGNPVQIFNEMGEQEFALQFDEYHYFINDDNKVIPIPPGSIISGKFGDVTEEEEVNEHDIRYSVPEANIMTTEAGINFDLVQEEAANSAGMMEPEVGIGMATDLGHGEESIYVQQEDIELEEEIVSMQHEPEEEEEEEHKSRSAGHHTRKYSSTITDFSSARVSENFGNRSRDVTSPVKSPAKKTRKAKMVPESGISTADIPGFKESETHKIMPADNSEPVKTNVLQSADNSEAVEVEKKIETLKDENTSDVKTGNKMPSARGRKKGRASKSKSTEIPNVEIPGVSNNNSSSITEQVMLIESINLNKDTRDEKTEIETPKTTEIMATTTKKTNESEESKVCLKEDNVATEKLNVPKSADDVQELIEMKNVENRSESSGKKRRRGKKKRSHGVNRKTDEKETSPEVVPESERVEEIPQEVERSIPEETNNAVGIEVIGENDGLMDSSVDKNAPENIIKSHQPESKKDSFCRNCQESLGSDGEVQRGLRRSPKDLHTNAPEISTQTEDKCVVEISAQTEEKSLIEISAQTEEKCVSEIFAQTEEKPVAEISMQTEDRKFVEVSIQTDELQVTSLKLAEINKNKIDDSSNARRKKKEHLSIYVIEDHNEKETNPSDEVSITPELETDDGNCAVRVHRISRKPRIADDSLISDEMKRDIELFKAEKKKFEFEKKKFMAMDRELDDRTCQITRRESLVAIREKGVALREKEIHLKMNRIEHATETVNKKLKKAKIHFRLTDDDDVLTETKRKKLSERKAVEDVAESNQKETNDDVENSRSNVFESIQQFLDNDANDSRLGSLKSPVYGQKSGQGSSVDSSTFSRPHKGKKELLQRVVESEGESQEFTTNFFFRGKVFV